MKWKISSPGIKLVTGFSILLALTTVFVIFSYESFGRLADKTGNVYRSNRIFTEIVQRDAEITDWHARVRTFLADASSVGTGIETDGRQCDFGRWLYGTGRKEAVSSFPALDPLFKKMEEPHSRMHSAAAEILVSRQQSGNDLENTLLQVQKKQTGWENAIKDVLLDDGKILEGLQLDPNQCELGKWMNSDDARTLYLANPEFAQLVQQLEPIHRRLHGSMSDIGKFLMSGDRLGAIAYYKRAAEPVFRKTYSLIDDIILLQKGGAIVNTADDIYTRELLPALQQVRNILDSTKQELREHTPSQSSFSAVALKTRDTIGLAGAIVIGMGILIAFVTARLIASSKFPSKSDFSPKEKTKVKKSQTEDVPHFTEKVAKINAHAERASEDLHTILDKINASAESQKQKTASSVNRIRALTATGNVIADTNALLDEIITQLSQMAKNATGTIETLVSELEQDESSLPGENPVREQSAHPAIADKLTLLLETVNEISEQTKLLSLNASIEAARAGTHGKGFSLIADEADELSKRSSDAAREIRQILEESPRSEAAPDQEVQTGIVKYSSTSDNSTAPSGKQSRFSSLTAMLANLTEEINDLAERLKAIAGNANEQTRELIKNLEEVAVDLDQVEEESSTQFQLVSQAGENIRFINESLANPVSPSGSSPPPLLENKGRDESLPDQNSEVTDEGEQVVSGEESGPDNGSQPDPIFVQEPPDEESDDKDDTDVSSGQESATGSFSPGPWSSQGMKDETGTADTNDRKKLIKKRLKKALTKYSRKR